MGGKLKVYLDTSVISHLMQEDVPEKMADTRKLWEIFQSGVYDVCLSTVTLQEIDDCSEPKRSRLWEFLNQIDYETYDVTEEALEVARQMIDLGILTKKNFDDCKHIGMAVVNNCDCMISWDFKNIVNIKTVRSVRAVAYLNGYRITEVLCPLSLFESEE